MKSAGPDVSWTVQRPRLLLVEGVDEARFFSALLRKTGGERRVQVLALGGKDALRRNLRILDKELAQSRIACRSLGVVRDADDDAARSLRSVRDALRDHGWEPPARAGAVAGDAPRVGIFVLPDGRSRGALETLCRRAVEDSVPGQCAEQFLDCLRKAGHEETSRSTDADKAFVHAYLASGRNPVARVGEAADQGRWDFGHPAFAPLVEFLSRLSAR